MFFLDYVTWHAIFTFGDCVKLSRGITYFLFYVYVTRWHISIFVDYITLWHALFIFSRIKRQCISQTFSLFTSYATILFCCWLLACLFSFLNMFFLCVCLCACVHMHACVSVWWLYDCYALTICPWLWNKQYIIFVSVLLWEIYYHFMYLYGETVGCIAMIQSQHYSFRIAWWIARLAASLLVVKVKGSISHPGNLKHWSKLPGWPA